MRENDQAAQTRQVPGVDQGKVVHGQGQGGRDHRVAHLQGEDVQVGVGQVPGLIRYKDADGFLPPGGEPPRIPEPAEQLPPGRLGAAQMRQVHLVSRLQVCQLPHPGDRRVPLVPDRRDPGLSREPGRSRHRPRPRPLPATHIITISHQ